jgi:hypothetical protein
MSANSTASGFPWTIVPMFAAMAPNSVEKVEVASAVPVTIRKGRR